MSIGFFFKKVIGTLLMPLPALTILLLAGVLLLWYTRYQRTGRVLCTTTLVLLYVLSLPFIPYACLTAIEQPTQETLVGPDSLNTDLQGVKWVVVLSGGGPGDPPRSSVNRVGGPTLGRLAEGIRVLRQTPDASLIVSGGDWEGGTPSADVMRAAAVDLGVESERIVVDAEAADTEQSAANVAEIVGRDSLVLVTSASHIPRSLQIFQQYGLNAIPARAGFTYGKPVEWSLFTFAPVPGNLDAVTTAWREFLGRIWARRNA